MSRVSFLLPVYNGAQFLSETLQSVLSQDYTDFDVVIIDDGSTDQTEEIISSFDDSRLRYIKRTNCGLVDTLNHGLDILDCEFVARIDADDICFPSRLTRQLDFIQFTQAIAISSGVININEAGRIINMSGNNTHFHNSNPKSIPAHEPYLPHPFMMARLGALRDVGGYRHAHLAEDSDLCWRLQNTGRTALQSDILGYYRQHSSNVSNQSIASGRVQALYSELAALNTVRRQSNQREIAYDISLKESLKLATSMETLIEILSGHLNNQEYKWLLCSAAVKLLDISTYRYLALTKGDITCARKTLESVDLSEKDKVKVSEIFSQVRKYHPNLFSKSIWNSFRFKSLQY